MMASISRSMYMLSKVDPEMDRNSDMDSMKSPARSVPDSQVLIKYTITAVYSSNNVCLPLISCPYRFNGIINEFRILFPVTRGKDWFSVLVKTM